MALALPAAAVTRLKVDDVCHMVFASSASGMKAQLYPHAFRP
jgi:hypothetical protein